METPFPFFHNRKGAEKSSEVLETLLSVRDQLQELRKQLDMIV